MDAFAVRLLGWREAAQQAAPVRRAVFIEEQGVPEALEWDGEDARAIHALATDRTGRPIGTARLVIRADEAQVGRMAVLRDWRGRGVGRALLQALLTEAQQRGIGRIVLHAQVHAVPFYRRFGFHPEGAEFLDAGIPHLHMTRILDRRTET